METRLHIGTFELTGRIGSGGMAEVWRAEHAALGTTVAVKVITGSRALDTRYHERFTREVQAVARLNHPGIVRVYDYGKVEGEGGHGIRTGSPFLAMELADRGTVEDDVPNDFVGLRRVLLQVLDALAYSHARGVVHRDIKPGNVLLTSGADGIVRAKLTDFGIAHADDPDTDATRGALNEAAGTPDYMPPEQLQGKWRDYGPWTDLYALGCMAWEISTGSVPFTGVSPIQIAISHLSDPLPAYEPRFAVPDGFVDWLHRLLAKAPHERFERAADAAFMLGRIDRAVSGQWDSPSSKVFIPSRFGTDLGDEISYGDENENEDETTIMMEPRGTDWEPNSEVFEVPDAATTVLNLSEMSWMEAGTGEAVGEAPPVPQNWRREKVDHNAVAAGMGLGLFGLREIPFVGRDDERDALWEALRDVATRRRPRTVVISGTSGTGKSRLVQWVAERAEEVGAATVLRAGHGPVDSAKHGIGHMLERFFVTWRLEESDAIRVRIQDHLQRLWTDDPDGSLEFLDHESRAMATIVAPNVERAPGQETFSSREERLACVHRVLVRVASRRPLILWVDDAQWAEEALQLAAALLDAANLPILVVLTVQEDARGDEGAGRLIEEIVRRPASRRLKLGFLDAACQYELIQNLVGLEERAAMRVVDATGGNPLFAVQLVSHWVERGALVPSHRGFLVDESADLPLEIHSLWTRRVDDLVARFGGESQRVALELAATLGDDVSDIEWQAICLISDVAPHERLVDELVNQGLAVRFEGGFSFVHKLLAESIRGEAEKRRVSAAHHAMCGEVLRTIYGRNPARVAERVANHFVRAESWDQAIEPLELVARLQIVSEDLAGLRETLRRHAYALDVQGIGPTDPRRVDNWLLNGTLQMRGGNPSAAEAEFQRVMTVAAAQNWSLRVAQAQRGFGELAANAGRLQEALEAYTRAENFFGDDSDPNELARLYEARAEVFRAIGNPAEARDDLERAYDLHRASGEAVQALNVFNRLAATYLFEGDMAAAREVAEMGIEDGRQLGNRSAEAGCWMILGEIERFENNVEYSRSCYAEAERLDELSGVRHVWLVRTHAALLEIAAENWLDASERLDELQKQLPAVGYSGRLPIVLFGQASCNAAFGDWQGFDLNWIAAVTDARNAGLIERDIAWLAELCGGLCERAGAIDRSRIAYEFAIQSWEALGELWKARELRIRVRAN